MSTATQGDLFETAVVGPRTLQEPRNEPPRQRHSATSCDAADAISGARSALHRRILAALEFVYPAGLTDLELQERCSMRESTERPRRVELVEAGLVRASGDVRVGEGRTRAATVWVLATNPGGRRR